MAGVFFQRVQVPYARRWYSEALASRKVVYCEVCTEGSEPAKVGTDEQKLNTRHGKSDEVTQHTDVQNARSVVFLM